MGRRGKSGTRESEATVVGDERVEFQFMIWLRDQAEERLRTRRAIYQTETEEPVLQHSWSYILLATLWYMRAW